jgi:hypothetical protein
LYINKKCCHDHELSNDDRTIIIEAFHEHMVPKLLKLHGRTGVLNCGFAGNRFKNWNIRFRSSGSGFNIVGFEYDEESTGLDLDL